MHKKTLLLSFATLLLFVGCATTVRIDVADPNQAVASPRAHASAMEALLSLDFAAFEAMSPSGDQRALARALMAMVKGDPLAARLGLEESLATATDKEVRSTAWWMLSKICFQEYRWDELLATLDANKDLEDPECRAYALAYSRFPAESVDFPEAPQTLPLDFTARGNMIVEVIVNGHARHFWVDTGANMTVLSSDVAAECGVLPLGQGEARSATKKIPASPAVIEELTIGGIKFNNHPAIIIQKENMEYRLLGFIVALKIDGIIGWPAIMKTKMTIDCPGKKVIFEKPIPRAIDNCTLFSLGYPMTFADSGELSPLLFGIDTGADRTAISNSLLAELGRADASARPGSANFSIGGTKAADSKGVGKFSISIGAARLNFDTMRTNSFDEWSSIKLDGLLGMDALSSSRVIFDYANGLFSIEAPGKNS